MARVTALLALALLSGCAEVVRCPNGEIFADGGGCTAIPDAGLPPDAASAPDAGSPDAGPPDAGPPDAGPSDGG